MAPFFMLDTFTDYLRSQKRFSEHTTTAYRRDIEQFLEFTGVCNSDEIKEVDGRLIRSWMVDLIDREYENTSVNRKLSSLRTYFKWLMKRGVILSNPMSLVEGPKMRKRPPSFVQKKELYPEKLTQYFHDDFNGVRDRMIFEVLYQTGVRSSELINLRDDFVQQEQIKVVGKRNKERIIPISGDLSSLIDTYRELRKEVISESPLFFVLNNGKKLYPKFVYSKINHYLGMVTDLDKRSPHVLRHTFATHMLNNGAGLEVLKELLGHADLSATQVYTHNSFAELTQIYSQSHPRGHKKVKAMDFKVNTVHFTADEKLVEFIQGKVKKLELMYDRIIASEIYLRLDKSEEKDNKVAEVKLLLPGNELFARKQCKSFEEAADLAVAALKKQVERYKAKTA